jgi:hypothetical protein
LHRRIQLETRLNDVKHFKEAGQLAMFSKFAQCIQHSQLDIPFNILQQLYEPRNSVRDRIVEYSCKRSSGIQNNLIIQGLPCPASLPNAPAAADRTFKSSSFSHCVKSGITPWIASWNMAGNETQEHEITPECGLNTMLSKFAQRIHSS